MTNLAVAFRSAFAMNFDEKLGASFLLDDRPPLVSDAKKYATMTDPREVAAFSINAVALVLALNCEWLPHQDSRLFPRFYCGTLALQFLVWSDEFCGHVRWLIDSQYTSQRGLGKWAKPLYGLVGMPPLSLGQFLFVLVALVVTLLAARISAHDGVSTLFLSLFFVLHLQILLSLRVGVLLGRAWIISVSDWGVRNCGSELFFCGDGLLCVLESHKNT